ncbi:Cloroperoxidase [Dendrothele bispora CBS 962.96]|uniref:Cloroperoxidase n=1 Tax=Dendrothele bispora (strain CBS 962.96) TaxID=1314807 RepID=A0A4S8LTF5_DENBC|nr:Cloroperoxidase [Dendrothele bispora CBS 962.96]
MFSKSLLLSFCTTALLVCVTEASGGPAEIDLNEHQWMAPGPNDFRGPCPGLNTLANHGFLPRDGKNLSMSVILDAALNGYHMQPASPLVGAVKISTLAADDPFSFTLEDIRLHGNIEHDASLSREDFALGNNFRFNETIFSTLANSNPGSDFYNTNSAGEVQRLRLADSEAKNPSINNTQKEFGIRCTESGFYLSVMGDPLVGVAPKEFVQIFFREERLPIAEGWHRSEIPINDTTLLPLIARIATASNWTSSGGCSVLEPVVDPSNGSQ